MIFTMASVLIGALGWGIANRLWGHDDAKDGVGKPQSALILGAFTGVFALIHGAGLLASFGVFLVCAGGFYLGRLSDGVRGTFGDKAIRGWKYGATYIGTALCLTSFAPLFPALFFWLGGPIHYAAFRWLAPDHDYVPAAEIVDGIVRGGLVLTSIAIALH